MGGLNLAGPQHANPLPLQGPQMPLPLPAPPLPPPPPQMPQPVVPPPREMFAMVDPYVNHPRWGQRPNTRSQTGH